MLRLLSSGWSKLESAIQQLPFMGRLSATTGMSNRALARTLLCTGILWLFFGGGLRWIGMMLGLAYPSYQTFKLIARHDGVEKPATNADGSFNNGELAPGVLEPKELSILKYWIVYSAFVAVTSVTDMFLWVFLGWGELLKIFFILYLQYFRGADLLFDRIIGPWLHQNVGRAEGIVRDVSGHATFLATQAPMVAAAGLSFATQLTGGLGGFSGPATGQPTTGGAVPGMMTPGAAPAGPTFVGSAGFPASSPAGPMWSSPTLPRPI